MQSVDLQSFVGLWIDIVEGEWNCVYVVYCWVNVVMVGEMRIGELLGVVEIGQDETIVCIINV